MSVENASVFTAPVARRNRLGAWAMVLGLFAGVWFFTGFAISQWGLHNDYALFLGIFAVILLVFGYVVVPIAAIGTIVLAVLALQRNATPGKMMAIVGLVVLVLVLIALITLNVGLVATNGL